MANLKLDLINHIRNDKYYKELELVRLSQDINIKYRNKIESMSNLLMEIASLNQQLELVEVYFKESYNDENLTKQHNNGQSHDE